jgi:hypothetical protein
MNKFLTIIAVMIAMSVGIGAYNLFSRGGQACYETVCK